MATPTRDNAAPAQTPGTAQTFDSAGSGPQCSICIAPLGDGVVLDPCGHSICTACFGSWASTCRCAAPGVPPECVHCETGRVECPFCRQLTTLPSDSHNDKKRRKFERDQRHALRRAREQRRREERGRRFIAKTFRVKKSSAGSIGLRFRGRDVTEVVENSPAAEAGLKPMMRILEVNHRPVADDSDVVHDALRDAPNTFTLKAEVAEPAPRTADANRAEQPQNAPAPQPRHADPAAAAPPRHGGPPRDEGIRIPAPVNVRSPDRERERQAEREKRERERRRAEREKEERERLARREREKHAAEQRLLYPDRHHAPQAPPERERERERAAEREREKLRGNQRVMRFLAEQRGVNVQPHPLARPAAPTDVHHRRPGMPADPRRGVPRGMMVGGAHRPPVAAYPMRHIMMP
eukprot:TRINITY_DN1339_c1_g2_i1.p1 TRINITY_DN1339_c1_g2~~TRINITY_DN1339_c1_g2_i1.p1  ORF type:complete len:409 (+),score=70.16 TRINITY_DN1339_c1_g2_i1:42-1268(+)